MWRTPLTYVFADWLFIHQPLGVAQGDRFRGLLGATELSDFRKVDIFALLDQFAGSA
jgi:hypothetical protein